MVSRYSHFVHKVWLNSLLEKFFLKIEVCDEMVNRRWSDFNMNDDEIAQSLLHNFNNTPSLEEIEEPEEKNLIWYYLFGITNKSELFRETAKCQM